MINSLDFALGKLLSACLELSRGEFPLDDKVRGQMACLKVVALRKNLLFDSQAKDTQLLHFAEQCEDDDLRRSLVDLDTKLKAARSQLTRQVLEELQPDPGVIARLTDQVDLLEQEAARKVAQMDKDAALHSAHALQALTPAAFLVELGKTLLPYTMVVEYVLLKANKMPADKTSEDKPGGYLAFVLVKGESNVKLEFLVLGPSQEIDDDIASFQELLTTLSYPPAGVEAGQRLRRALLDKVLHVAEQHLGRRPEHLFLCPDGDLFRLPFTALPVDTSSESKEQWLYVLDEPFSISYLNAARDLFKLHALSPATAGSALKTCRVFFNPQYDALVQEEKEEDSVAAEISDGALRDSLFTPLPNTAEEGKALAALFHAKALVVEPFEGEAATKQALLATRRPLILHIATHGFYVPFMMPEDATYKDEHQRVSGQLKQVPQPLLRCGIVMSGVRLWQELPAAPRQSSGIVTGLELLNLNLRGTKLVTFSACDTGAGDIAKGQGMACLGRVALLAGAETALVTACPVNDASTKDLMESFYAKLLQEGGDPFHRARALRDAQRDVRQKTYTLRRGWKVTGHPHLWAPLTLYGAVGPMF